MEKKSRHLTVSAIFIIYSYLKLIPLKPHIGLQLTQKNKAHYANPLKVFRTFWGTPTAESQPKVYIGVHRGAFEEQRSYSKLIPLKPHIGLQLTQKFKAYRSTPDEGYLCDSQGRVRGTTQNFKVNLIQVFQGVGVWSSTH